MPRGRKPKLIPTVSWPVRIPGPLAAAVDLLLCDAMRGGTTYGARSELVAMLLAQWLREKKSEYQETGVDTQGEGKE